MLRPLTGSQCVHRVNRSLDVKYKWPVSQPEADTVTCHKVLYPELSVHERSSSLTAASLALEHLLGIL